MKNWQKYLVLAGAAMRQNLCRQEIKQVIEALG